MKVTKIHQSLLRTAFFAVLAGALFVACGETKTEWVCAPSVSSTQPVVTAPDQGGSLSVSYTVSNPTSNGSVSASSSVSWISVIDCSDDNVSLSVSANPNSEPRTARITISYAYSLAGSKGTSSCEVTVAQSYGDSPAISVQPVAVTAAIEGGQYDFEYTVINPTADGGITATTSVSWISNIDTSTDGKVSFYVAENEEESMRSAKIELCYVYSTGTVSESVTVVQNHVNGEGPGTGGYDLSAFVGTYSCTGIVYNLNYDGVTDTNQGATDTWTMKIYGMENGTLLISGLVPDTVDFYPYNDEVTSSGPYTASATVSENDILISVPQFTGWATTSHTWGQTYTCWIPCVKYEDGKFSYSLDSTTVTFSYSDSDNSWTCDYGLFLGLCLTRGDVSTYVAYNDVFAPGMTFKKTSDTTGIGENSSSHQNIEEMASHTGATLYKK